MEFLHFHKLQVVCILFYWLMVIREHLKTAISDPRRLLVAMNRMYYRRLNTVRKNPEGVNFIDEDWDNLIILDACRYDYFNSVSELPGETKYTTSLGSTSREFVAANFRGKHLYDTIYVSANGWYDHLREEIDSDVFYFNYCDRDAAEGLTTKPETVTKTALEEFERHPQKRFIIHYMQPHQPYLGNSADWIEHGSSLSKTVKSNNISREELEEAYRKNLQLVLIEVKRLIDQIPGKTVVTADHGEFLGEKQWPIPVRDYGHPYGIYMNEVVKVPWHTYESGTRKIKSEEKSRNQESNAEIEDHLTALGYKI